MSRLFAYLWPLFTFFSAILFFELKFDYVGLSFFLNGLIICLLLSNYSKNKVNIYTIYNIFNITFMTIIPWIHYSNNITIWRGNLIGNDVYIYINSMILLSTIIIYVVYFYAFNITKYNYKIYNIERKHNDRIYVLLGVSIISFIGLLYTKNFSVSALFFRGLEGGYQELLNAPSPIRQVFESLFRFIPFFSFLYVIKTNKKAYLIKLLMLIIVIFCVFPTGVPRFMVAFVYIPLILVFVKIARVGWLFSFIFIYGLVIIFPFLDQFRYYSNMQSLRFVPSADFFFAAHFDAYENFASAVDSAFVSYGYQLLGSLFFFIPRSLWPDKPVGSGYQLAEISGYSWKNISMPYLGEGYVNFGFIGVMLFAIIGGFLMGRLDRIANIRRIKFGENNYETTFYYFIIGSTFFTLRGDLMSAFSFLSSGVVASWIVKRL